jgi:hypothetical protein
MLTRFSINANDFQHGKKYFEFTGNSIYHLSLIKLLYSKYPFYPIKTIKHNNFNLKSFYL